MASSNEGSKACSTCYASLPCSSYSKKQWQAKKLRRCKDCITLHRQIIIDDVQLKNERGDKDEWAQEKKLLMDSNKGVESLFGPIDIEKLFKQPKPTEDCPICMLPLPLTTVEQMYMSCCGKTICSACMYGICRSEVQNMIKNPDLNCAFCRSPAPDGKTETMKRMNDRIASGDAQAVHLLGMYHKQGSSYWPVSPNEAIKMWFKAAKMGWVESHMAIGDAYDGGYGFLPSDPTKAQYHYSLAAIGGDIVSRYNLGVIAANDGNFDTAYRHWSIAAKQGNETSLERAEEGHMSGYISKQDFEEIRRAHKEAVERMSSTDRKTITKDEPFLAPEMRNRPVLDGNSTEEEKSRHRRKIHQEESQSSKFAQDEFRSFINMIGMMGMMSGSSPHPSPPEGQSKDAIEQLHYACRDGQLRKVRDILKENPELSTKNYTSFGSISPLEITATSSHKHNLDIVKLLIKHGADIYQRDPQFGQLPLHRSCEQGVQNLVQFFLDSGMDPNLKDGTGQSCLCVAAENGQTDVCKLLLDRGAKASLSERYKGMTPKQWAEMERHYECARIL